MHLNDEYYPEIVIDTEGVDEKAMRLFRKKSKMQKIWWMRLRCEKQRFIKLD